LWLAPSTEDVNLAIRWLEARGIARCASISELQSPESIAGSPRVLDCSRTPVDLTTLRGPANLCVVCVNEHVPPSGWRVIRSPFVGSIVEALVEWLAPRLPQDGRFVPSEVLRCLKRAARDGIVDGLHAALGLAATLDELGSVPADTSWAELARRLIDARLAESTVGSRAETSWLKDNAYTALVGMVGAALAQSETRWDAARSTEQWWELVPYEFQRGVDAEWARVSLGRANRKLSAHELEHALANTPPGAYRLTRALSAARLLEGDADVHVAPRWLALWLKAASENELLRSPVEEWGEVLLQPHAAPSLRLRLSQRLITDSGPILDALLEADDDVDDVGDADDAATALVAETLFELVGTLVSQGQTVDLEQLRFLWELQARLWITLDESRVVPRVLCSPGGGDTHYGTWLLAAWALSEKLGETGALPIVAPWSDPDGLPVQALDEVHRALATPVDRARSEDLCTQRLAGYALVGRLFAAVPQGLVDHSLMLLPRLILGTADWSVWQRLVDEPECLTCLLHVAGDRFARLAGTAWERWSEGGRSVGRSVLHPAEAACRRFWPHLPESVLKAMLLEHHPFISKLPYQALSADGFRLLLLGDHEIPEQGMSHLPPALLSAAVDTLARHSRAGQLEALWRHFEDSMARELVLLLEAEEWPTVRALFASAPAKPVHPVFEFVTERVESRGVADPSALLARSWLQTIASSNHPARLEGYSLLADIERRLGRVRSASG
jgi:hypothetical protein